MEELRDFGLIELSETYTLTREELLPLRGLGGKLFETVRSAMPRLGISLGVALPSLKIATLGDVLRSFPSGIVLTVRFGERAGGMLAMSAALKAAAMEIVFAGSRRWTGQEQLTDLELAAVGRILGRAVAGGFSAGFAKVFGVEALPTGAFSVEAMVAETVLAEDKVVAFTSSTDGGGSAMVGAIELSPLVPLRTRLKELASIGFSGTLNTTAALKRLGQVRVEVCAILGSLQTSFAEMRKLKCGSYLPLGKLRGETATVALYAGGQRIGSGQVVEDRGWRRVVVEHSA